VGIVYFDILPWNQEETFTLLPAMHTQL